MYVEALLKISSLIFGSIKLQVLKAVTCIIKVGKSLDIFY